MTKFTWRDLQIFLEQYKLTPDDAMQIVLDNLFVKEWKHGAGGKLGRMWRDPMVVSTFTHVLAEEDKIAKTTTRKKVYAELFKSKAFETFRITAELKFNSHSRTKNDYSKWKRLPMFEASWKKGTITLDKLRKKIAAKNKKLN